MINNLEKFLGGSLSSLRAATITLNIVIPETELIGDESYIQLPNEGVSFLLSDGVMIVSIHFYAEGRDGYAKYKGDIIGGVSFDMSRTAIRKLLGMPKSFKDAYTVPILGKMPAWDLFLKDGYSIHVEYEASEKSVSLITIGI